jgi:hypothetical protein
MPTASVRGAFVSSTVNNLADYRAVMKDAILESDCHPILCENW